MKNVGVIVRRYALAIYQVAVSQKLAAEFKLSANLLEKALNPRFLKSLQNPSLSADEKRKIFQDVCVSLNAPQSFLNGVFVVVENGRSALLSQILGQLNLLLNQELGVEEVSVTSAAALSKTELKEIEETISKLVKKSVVISSSIREELLSGIVVKVGNSVVDASLASQLQSIKESLSQGA